MAKKKWSTTRKWEVGTKEQNWINLLEENNYTIVGIREYMSKTDYLLEKNGLQMEYNFPHEGDVNVKKFFELFQNTFSMYEELTRLKALV